MAHPLDDGRVAMLERSVAATAAGLGDDAAAYRHLMAPLVRDADKLMPFVLGPFNPFPRHPLAAARFGFPALRSARGLAGSFRDELAPALMTGLSGHAMVPLGQPLTSAFGLVLGISAHAYGWPVVRGGTQVMADAMAARLRSLGGEIVTGRPIASLDELPAARAILFDTTPRALAAIAGDRLPDRYRRRIEGFRYGAGIFKLDWALDGPIPWRTESVGRAGTVHLGGTWREIAAAEDDVTHRPASRSDRSSSSSRRRRPTPRVRRHGRETGWAYCHVPNGSTVDMTERIEAQVERFAPGFRDRILARAVRSPAQLEHDNPNYIGGDINGGIQDWRQLFTRPVAKLDPYATPTRGLYLCSSSTPPGGGVHGMCGVWAARSALKREFGTRA